MARNRRLNQRLLKQAMDHLAAADPDMARALEQCGMPPLRSSEPGFPTLLRSIVGQQVSVQAARSIWTKLTTLIDPLTPATLLTAGETTLRAAGFSSQKIRYGLALAGDVVNGTVDLDALDGMDDEAAIATLVRAKGVGRWTAEIYLMFALGRPDVMPGNDLGLIVAAQHLKRLRKRPEPKRMLMIAEPWRPWRTAAALLLWHYRHNMPDWSTPPTAAANARRQKQAA